MLGSLETDSKMENWVCAGNLESGEGSETREKEEVTHIRLHMRPRVPPGSSDAVTFQSHYLGALALFGLYTDLSEKGMDLGGPFLNQ